MDVYFPSVIEKIVESYLGAIYFYYYKHNDLSIVKYQLYDFEFGFIKALYNQGTLHVNEYVCYCIWHYINDEVDRYWNDIDSIAPVMGTDCSDHILDIVCKRKNSGLYERVFAYGCYSANFICLLDFDLMKQKFYQSLAWIWKLCAINHNRLDILQITGDIDSVRGYHWHQMDIKSYEYVYGKCNNNEERDHVVLNALQFSCHYEWATSKRSDIEHWPTRYSLEYMKSRTDFHIYPSRVLTMTLEEAQEFKRLRGFDQDYSQMTHITLFGDIERVMFLVQECELKPHQYILCSISTWHYDDIQMIIKDPKHLLHDKVLHFIKHASTCQNALLWLMTHFTMDFKTSLSLSRRTDVLFALRDYPIWREKWKTLFSQKELIHIFL